MKKKVFTFFEKIWNSIIENSIKITKPILKNYDIIFYIVAFLSGLLAIYEWIKFIFSFYSFERVLIIFWVLFLIFVLKKIFSNNKLRNLILEYIKTDWSFIIFVSFIFFILFLLIWLKTSILLFSLILIYIFITIFWWKINYKFNREKFNIKNKLYLSFFIFSFSVSFFLISFYDLNLIIRLLFSLFVAVVSVWIYLIIFTNILQISKKYFTNIPVKYEFEFKKSNFVWLFIILFIILTSFIFFVNEIKWLKNLNENMNKNSSEISQIFSNYKPKVKEIKKF